MASEPGSNCKTSVSCLQTSVSYLQISVSYLPTEEDSLPAEENSQRKRDKSLPRNHSIKHILQRVGMFANIRNRVSLDKIQIPHRSRDINFGLRLKNNLYEPNLSGKEFGMVYDIYHPGNRIRRRDVSVDPSLGEWVTDPPGGGADTRANTSQVTFQRLLTSPDFWRGRPC